MPWPKCGSWPLPGGPPPSSEGPAVPRDKREGRRARTWLRRSPSPPRLCFAAGPEASAHISVSAGRPSLNIVTARVATCERGKEGGGLLTSPLPSAGRGQARSGPGTPASAPWGAGSWGGASASTKLLARERGGAGDKVCPGPPPGELNIKWPRFGKGRGWMDRWDTMHSPQCGWEMGNTPCTPKQPVMKSQRRQSELAKAEGSQRGLCSPPEHGGG